MPSAVASTFLSLIGRGNLVLRASLTPAQTHLLNRCVVEQTGIIYVFFSCNEDKENCNLHQLEQWILRNDSMSYLMQKRVPEILVTKSKKLLIPYL